MTVQKCLQILTSLEAFIPINLLVFKCQTGVDSLSKIKTLVNTVRSEIPTEVNVTETANSSEETANLKCFIMMLDVLLKQVCNLT